MTADPLPPRLAGPTVGRVPATCRPRVLPADVLPGILHLGLGAFHRAHQAVYTERALADAGGDWGIVAVAPRSRAVVEELAAQDGLFSVTRLASPSPSVEDTRVVGAVTGVLHAPSDPRRVVGLLASPDIRVVTLTVTEKGYRLDPATGRLRTDDRALWADLRGDRSPTTVPGMLVRGLIERARADAGPLTVLSCDNLPQNGRLVAGLVEQALDAAWPAPDEGVRAWVRDSVTFPSSMVDRIVPAPGDDALTRARSALGVSDLVAVDAEPYAEWVIEDAFAAGRPSWESAGAMLVDDTRPWEKMKLRALNGAHSAVAYLGALAGRETVAESVGLAGMETFLRRMLADDVVPSLKPPPGVDPGAYGATVLERFATPAIGHRVRQVATDGSQKLPQRLLGTAADRLAAGGEPRWIALAVAGWMRFLLGHADDGRELPLEDPLAGRLRGRVRASGGSPAATAAGLLDELSARDLAENTTFRALVRDWLRALEADGAAATLARLESRYSGRR